jgi:hypothetical protein
MDWWTFRTMAASPEAAFLKAMDWLLDRGLRTQ